MHDDIFKYDKDIVWSLPIIFQYETVWGTIFKLFQKYEIELPQVNGFGCPACVWTGGRAPAVKEEYTESRIVRILEYLKSIKVTPSFTFTCTQLTQDDLKNRYANYLLDIALDYDCHFIVYDDRLKDHIKNKKSDAYIVASVIKPAFKFQGPLREMDATVEIETEFYNKLLKEYDLIVVRPEYSKTALLNNPELIDDISKVEALINQPCIHNCPKMPLHYRHLENFRTGQMYNAPFECARKNLPPNVALENTLCHSEEMTKKLIANGVKHLKLQGRGVNTMIVSHAFMLYNQLFKIDGPHYCICQELLHGILDEEFDYFIKEVIR